MADGPCTNHPNFAVPNLAALHHVVSAFCLPVRILYCWTTSVSFNVYLGFRHGKHDLLVMKKQQNFFRQLMMKKAQNFLSTWV